MYTVFSQTCWTSFPVFFSRSVYSLFIFFIFTFSPEIYPASGFRHRSNRCDRTCRQNVNATRADVAYVYNFLRKSRRWRYRFRYAVPIDRISTFQFDLSESTAEVVYVFTYLCFPIGSIYRVLCLWSQKIYVYPTLWFSRFLAKINCLSIFFVLVYIWIKKKSIIYVSVIRKSN